MFTIFEKNTVNLGTDALIHSASPSLYPNSEDTLGVTEEHLLADCPIARTTVQRTPRLQSSHTNTTVPLALREARGLSESPSGGAAVVSNETSPGKTCRTVMKLRLHPSTAQEKYHYQTERL